MSFVTHNFLEDMALVLCVAALASVICQVLRQPLVVGYLVAGMVVGPYVPGLYANTERVHLFSDLGVTVLIFSIGLEFNFRRLLRLAPTGRRWAHRTADEPTARLRKNLRQQRKPSAPGPKSGRKIKGVL